MKTKKIDIEELYGWGLDEYWGYWCELSEVVEKRFNREIEVWHNTEPSEIDGVAIVNNHDIITHEDKQLFDKITTRKPDLIVRDGDYDEYYFYFKY